MTQKLWSFWASDFPSLSFCEMGVMSVPSSGLLGRSGKIYVCEVLGASLPVDT